MKEDGQVVSDLILTNKIKSNDDKLQKKSRFTLLFFFINLHLEVITVTNVIYLFLFLLSVTDLKRVRFWIPFVREHHYKHHQATDPVPPDWHLVPQPPISTFHRAWVGWTNPDQLHTLLKRHIGHTVFLRDIHLNADNIFCTWLAWTIEKYNRGRHWRKAFQILCNVDSYHAKTFQHFQNTNAN